MLEPRGGSNAKPRHPSWEAPAGQRGKAAMSARCRAESGSEMMVNVNSMPKVQYAYCEMSGGANHRRLTSMTFPDGDVVNDNYGSGLNDTTSRLSSLSDTSKESSDTNYLPTRLRAIVVIVWSLGLFGCEKPEEKPVATFQRNGMGGVTALGYLNSRQLVVIGTGDGVVRLWDPATNRVVAELFEKREPFSMAVDPKEKWIAVAQSDRVIRIWNIDKKSIDARLKVSLQNTLHNIAAGADGDHVAFAAIDDSVRLWKISTGKEIKRLVGHKTSIQAIAISKDGSKLASGDSTGNVIVWDLESGRIDRRIRANDNRYVIHDLIFLDGSRLVAAANDDDTVTVWETSSGKRQAELKGDNLGGTVWCFARSPDGKSLASANVNGGVAIWDVKTWKRRQWFGAHNATTVAATFNKDGTQIITGCAKTDFEDREGDGEVKVWKVK